MRGFHAFCVKSTHLDLAPFRLQEQTEETESYRGNCGIDYAKGPSPRLRGRSRFGVIAKLELWLKLRTLQLHYQKLRGQVTALSELRLSESPAPIREPGLAASRCLCFLRYLLFN